MSMPKSIYYLIMFSLTGCLSFVGLLIYWVIVPISVSDYITWPTEKNIILNEGKIVRRGEIIQWAVDATFKRDFSSDASRFIMSNKEGCNFAILQNSIMSVKKGRRNYINTNFVVPKDFRPCTYFVRISNRIQVNPIRWLEFNRDTEEFQVI